MRRDCCMCPIQIDHGVPSSMAFGLSSFEDPNIMRPVHWNSNQGWQWVRVRLNWWPAVIRGGFGSFLGRFRRVLAYRFQPSYAPDMFLAALTHYAIQLIKIHTFFFLYIDQYTYLTLFFMMWVPWDLWPDKTNPQGGAHSTHTGQIYDSFEYKTWEPCLTPLH